MRSRRLGPFTATAIGSGAIDLAVSAARGVARGDVEHALHEAIEIGITLLEVAGDGDSEKLAGDAVRAQRARDRVAIATRVALLDERPGPPRDVLRERLPPPYLQGRVEASLRATRLDALPLVQLALRPGWLVASSWPELVGTCARLVREGKVLAWGAVLDEPEHEAAAALIAEPWLSAVAVVYHLWERRAEKLFEAAAARELAVLARQPLAGGALTGRLGPGVRLPPRDDRHALDDAALERIAVGVARLTPLVKLAPPAVRTSDAARGIAETAARPAHVECRDVAELALRFAIDRGAIALPRLHRREHLLDAVAAAMAPPLSPAVVDQVAPAEPVAPGAK